MKKTTLKDYLTCPLAVAIYTFTTLYAILHITARLIVSLNN